jgi:hypothetical protein
MKKNEKNKEIIRKITTDIKILTKGALRGL